MSAYIAIRVLLLLALALTAWWLVRPVSSASSLALRRIGIGVLVAAAIVAILVPSLANTVALIAQMVTGYRGEARAEARMARLARSLALAHVLPPEDTTPENAIDPLVHTDDPEVERAANGPDSPTNPPDNDMVTNDE